MLRAQRANVDKPQGRVLQNAVSTPLWQPTPVLYFFDRLGLHKMGSVSLHALCRTLPKQMQRHVGRRAFLDEQVYRTCLVCVETRE